jgi:hypothetical protein
LKNVKTVKNLNRKIMGSASEFSPKRLEALFHTFVMKNLYGLLVTVPPRGSRHPIQLVLEICDRLVQEETDEIDFSEKLEKFQKLIKDARFYAPEIQFRYWDELLELLNKMFPHSDPKWFPIISDIVSKSTENMKYQLSIDSSNENIDENMDIMEPLPARPRISVYEITTIDMNQCILGLTEPECVR